MYPERKIKTWGEELILENNEKYCGKIITVDMEWSSGGKYHKHEMKDETFFPLEGVVEIEIIDDQGFVQRTYLFSDRFPQSYRILPGTYHRFRGAKGKSKFIEISTHDSPEDNYYGIITKLGFIKLPNEGGSK